MEQQYRPGGFKMLPPIIKNLLIINGLFFLGYATLEKSMGIDLNALLGMHYIGAEDFRPYQLITYLFMHHDFSHILFNMFALWMFGNTLENIWGPKRFLIYYFVTGVGAVLIHAVVLYFEMSPILSAIDEYIASPSNQAFIDFMQSSNFQIVSIESQNHYMSFYKEYNNLLTSNPSAALRNSIEFMQQYRIDYMNAPTIVGASGAVFGILLAFGMMFPNSVIYLYFAIPIKTKYFVIIYGAIELYTGFANEAGDNVAHFAHLGGMIFGFILIKLWNNKKTNKWIS